VLKAVAAEPGRLSRMRAALVEARDAFRIDDFGASATPGRTMYGDDGSDSGSNESFFATHIKVTERRRAARKEWEGNNPVDTGIFYGLLLEELRGRHHEATRRNRKASQVSAVQGRE